MTAQNHYCKSCTDARNGAPIPYRDLDPEMVDVVKALNTVPGMRTLDSCFGHPSSGDPNKSHQTNAYVGLTYTGLDRELLQHFWDDFFQHNYGKLAVSTGYVQFDLVLYPCDPDPNFLIRLNIDGEHDPAIDPRGVQEKKEALLLLQKFITKYLQDHQEFAEQSQKETAMTN